jgi:hypothetical protein
MSQEVASNSPPPVTQHAISVPSMTFQNAVCISMAASNRHGFYRFSLAGDVFYVEAHKSAVLRDIEYGFPPAILRLLSPRPQSCNWADIKDGDRVEWSNRILKEVKGCWHPQKIDLRELEPIKYYNERVCQCSYESRLVVAKIARFEFEVDSIERETLAYRIIDGQNIGPQFLGHLTENGRVMGVLLEYIPKRPASITDLGACLNALQKLHTLDILLNDTNKFNFLAKDDSPEVLVCDFENCILGVDLDKFKAEIDGLENSLGEDESLEDGWEDFGKERLKTMQSSDYRI